MTTQQERIDAILAKYEPDAWLWKNEPHGETVCSGPGDPYPAEAVPHRTDETVSAMLAEALAEKAQGPVAWRSKRDVLLDAAAVFPVVLRKMWSGGDVVEWLCGEADRVGTTANATTPPTAEAAAQAAALAMQRHCAEFVSRNLYDCKQYADEIRALPLETGALREMMMEVARAVRKDCEYLASDDDTKVTLIPKIEEIVDRILAGKGEGK